MNSCGCVCSSVTAPGVHGADKGGTAFGNELSRIVYANVHLNKRLWIHVDYSAWSRGSGKRGCSSNGRALAQHARGTGIDTLHLHFLLSSCTEQLFPVPVGGRHCCKGRHLWSIPVLRKLLTFPDQSTVIHCNPLCNPLGTEGGGENTSRGARTHDHKVKGLALCRLS